MVCAVRRWTGSRMPLTLAGGGVQLVTYVVAKSAVDGESSGADVRKRVEMIGRRPPRVLDAP